MSAGVIVLGSLGQARCSPELTLAAGPLFVGGKGQFSSKSSVALSLGKCAAFEFTEAVEGTI